MERPYGLNANVGCESAGKLDKKGPRLNRYYESLKPYYKLNDSNDRTLVFESRFESGNLKRAVKV